MTSTKLWGRERDNDNDVNQEIMGVPSAAVVLLEDAKVKFSGVSYRHRTT